MIFRETALNGAFVVELDKKGDERGFFARAWCRNEFESHGLVPSIVQSNLSFNKARGTLRGMHYQIDPFAEAKLVRCVKGAIYDAIIDLRTDSATFMKWISVVLTEDNYKMLYVPEGFAHGFQTLVDDSIVFYHVSQFYSPEHERGIRWDDPSFAIEWPDMGQRIISDKDKRWPDFSAAVLNGEIK